MPKKTAVRATNGPGAADTRPKASVATEATREASPAKPKPPPSRLTSWCKTAQLVDAGTVATETSGPQWHSKCKGVLLGANGQVQCVCPCGCHKDQKRCSDCGTEDAELDPATLRCANRPHCAERIQRALEATDIWKLAEESRRRAAAATSDTLRAPSATRPREGRCQHCGEPTRGGIFLPGHDAKLKGELKRAAAAGGVPAAVEVIVRGWDVPADRSWPTYGEALAIAEGLPEDGGQWLRDCVALRIEQL